MEEEKKEDSTNRLLATQEQLFTKKTNQQLAIQKQLFTKQINQQLATQKEQFNEQIKQQLVTQKEQFDEQTNQQLATQKEQFDEQTNQQLATQKQLTQQLENQKNMYNDFKDKLSDLVMAGSLTTLAQELKKTKEDHANKEKILRHAFYVVIFWILCLSIIPWLISIFFENEILNSATSLIRVYSFVLPLIWVGILLNKNINSSRRLLEEYTHKHNVATTFLSLNEKIKTMKIEASTLNKLEEQLIFNLLNTISYNPSEHSDKKQHDFPTTELIKIIESQNIANQTKDKLLDLLVSKNNNTKKDP